MVGLVLRRLAQTGIVLAPFAWVILRITPDLHPLLPVLITVVAVGVETTVDAFGLLIPHLSIVRFREEYRSKKPKIASDLAGVTALTFDGTTSNLQAAVGSACSSIRTIARRFEIRHEPVSRGYKPLDELVPPDARLVALVGQNLASRLGFLDDERARFREQLHNVLALKTLERLYLVLLSPGVLESLHPEAWQHLRDITVPAIRAIHAELPGLLTSKMRVCVHPAATLSLLAIDWDDADRKRILVMPKLQRPRRPMALGDRIVVSLAHELCDIDELRWMIYDAEQQKDGARSAKLADAERMLLDELASP